MNLIVGVDPGATVGIAMIDLDGNVVKLFSQKELSQNGVIRFIEESGKPLVIASDVTSLPSSISKIARAFDAATFSPKDNILQSEKIEMTKNFDIKNDHERDALVAALLAYNYFYVKINKARKIAKKRQEDIIAASFHENRLNKVLRDVTKIPKEKKIKKKSQPKEKKTDETLKKKVDFLQEYNIKLKDENKKMKKKTERLENKIKNKRWKPVDKSKRIKKLQERIKIKDKEVRKSEEEVKSLKELLSKIPEGEYTIMGKKTFDNDYYESVKDLGRTVIAKLKKKEGRKISEKELEDIIKEHRG